MLCQIDFTAQGTKILKYFLAIIFSLCSSVAYADWGDEILKHKLQMQQKTYELILAQYEAYKTDNVPKIAADIIQLIPIHDSNESLISLKLYNTNLRIRMMDDPKDPFQGPDFSAGFDESAKMRIGVYRALEKTLTNLDSIASSFGYKPGQISIRVFEGLRLISTQKTLFENKLKQIKDENPKFSDEQAYEETSKWVSPVQNNIPVQSTGAAVFIRLYDEQAQTYLDMGQFGIFWSDNKTAPTFSADITAAQINNRLFLLIAATDAGFINYPYAYWHYSIGDRYAAYWRRPSPLQAIYGQV